MVFVETRLIASLQGQQSVYYIGDIRVNHNRPVLNLFHRERLAEVDGGVGGLWVLHRHLDERDFENDGGVAAAAEVEEQ